MASGFSVTVEVPNLLALQARLTELGVVKVPLAMRKVLVAGAKPMKAAIAAETPVARAVSASGGGAIGDLKRGIRFKAGRTDKALYMIGPMGKGTAHRALVIRGHEIVGHAPNLTRTGKRTKPNPFVERGQAAGQGPALAAIATAAAAAIEAAAKL